MTKSLSDINIRALNQNEWDVYKSLRLAALKDSPDSFSSTFERESAFQDAEWISRLNYNEDVDKGLLIIAELDDSPVGLACGIVHSEEDRNGHLYQMWVSPNTRGLGVGKQLLAHIISWAKDAKLRVLSLDVTAKNAAAIHLYTSSGFNPDGTLDELRSGSQLKTLSMTLNLIDSV